MYLEIVLYNYIIVIILPSKQDFSREVELIWKKTTMADMVCCSLWIVTVLEPRGSSSSSSHASGLSISDTLLDNKHLTQNVTVLEC
jgi:hypothetical protein